jgi:hypothetical protein
MAWADITGVWAPGGRVMTGDRQRRRARPHPAVATEGVDMVPRQMRAGAVASLLAALALAGPADAAQQDLRSPDAHAAAAPRAQQLSDVITGGARAPDERTPDAREAAPPIAPSVGARTPVPSVVEITSAEGFDWTSAGIGAGGGIALVVIALAGATAVSSRSRPAPH